MKVYDKDEKSENESFQRSRSRGKQRASIMRHPEEDRRDRKRERERDRARELHAIRITSIISKLGYVIFVAQLTDVRSMHILNFNTINAGVLMGKQQNNQHNFVINCCFGGKQHAWITCRWQLIIAMETIACFRKAGKQGLLGKLSPLCRLISNSDLQHFNNPVSDT